MNPDQENFELLRKLLALKKYEQPPPRYFSELPSRIWTRIERETQSSPFWARLFSPNFGLSPALAYSFGLLACGSLVFGIGYGLKNEPEATATRSNANANLLLASPRLAPKESESNLSNFQAMQLASTNPVMNSEPLPSLFNTPNLRIEPASYSPGQ